MPIHPRPWAETKSSPILRCGYVDAIVVRKLRCDLICYFQRYLSSLWNTIGLNEVAEAKETPLPSLLAPRTLLVLHHPASYAMAINFISTTLDWKVRVYVRMCRLQISTLYNQQSAALKSLSRTSVRFKQYHLFRCRVQSRGATSAPKVMKPRPVA